MENIKYISEVCAQVLTGDVVKAVKYISPKFIIRATRTRYSGKLIKNNVEITLSLSKPNYIEREFIKQCQKVGEPFPVKKVQIKVYNPSPKKLKRK